MITMKNFTDGLAVLLAILILIYALTLYSKFNPNENKLEEGISKPIQFIEDASTNRDHLRLLLVVSLSALAGFLFRKRPELSGLFSVFAFCFILTLCENKQLVKYPNVIIILALAHLAGNMAYTALFDSENGTNRCMALSVIGWFGALTVSSVCSIYQNTLRKTAEIAEEMTEAGLELSDKIRFIPDAVRTVYRHFGNEGISEARDVMYSLETQVINGPMRTKFLDDISVDQYRTYLRLSILLFAALILTVAFSKRFRFVAAAVSAVPFIYEFVSLQGEKLSALPLAIVSLSIFSLIMNIAAVSTNKRQYSVFSEDDDDEPENDSPESKQSDPEDISYT